MKPNIRCGSGETKVLIADDEFFIFEKFVCIIFRCIIILLLKVVPVFLVMF